jgi:hypothetical protein
MPVCSKLEDEARIQRATVAENLPLAVNCDTAVRSSLDRARSFDVAAGQELHPGGEDRGLIARVGRLAIDCPRSAGYYGGVAAAVGLGLIDPPLGLFIAAVPFLKMLNHDSAPRAARMVGQFFEGMAKPVGGDGEGTIVLVDGERTTKPQRRRTRARRPRQTPVRSRQGDLL